MTALFIGFGFTYAAFGVLFYSLAAVGARHERSKTAAPLPRQQLTQCL